MRKAVFWRLKGGLLEGERPPFAKPLTFRWLRMDDGIGYKLDVRLM